MALTDSTNKPEKKPHETHRQTDKREKPLTKVVIRRLPPNIDQETFLNQVSPVPDYDYIYTVKGDASLGENAFSRVYINFTKSEDIYAFKEKFDNYVFIDSRGHEYPAVVEFASFQKIPKKRNKNRIDPKCGTIESDPVYLEFLESLKKPQETEVKAEYSYQISTDSKKDSKQDTTTPLLEYIKNKRAERLRIREERREERKRKELERKKVREDERRKRFDDKSPIKSVVIKAQSSKTNLKESKIEEDAEKPEKDGSLKETHLKTYEKSYYKNKEKKYEDRSSIKHKFGSKKEYPERREYKSRWDEYKERNFKDRDYKERDHKDRDYKDRDYRSKYDDRRETETKSVPKKVKKYSERREERMVEAQKAEQKKTEKTVSEGHKSQDSVSPSPKSEETSPKKPHKEKSPEPKEAKEPKDNKETTEAQEPKEIVETKVDTESMKRSSSVDNTEQSLSESSEKDHKTKEKDSDCSQKRIRNKDRPTIAIYRPGMLSKRRQEGSDSENKDTKKE